MSRLVNVVNLSSCVCLIATRPFSSICSIIGLQSIMPVELIITISTTIINAYYSYMCLPFV